MNASIRDTDGLILQHGIGIAEIAGARLVELTDVQEQAIRTALSQNLSCELILNADGSIGVSPIQLPPPIPAPNISDLIAALATSPSIDQATKDKLTTALEGS